MNTSYSARHVARPQPTRRIITGRKDCITGHFPSRKAAMGYRMVAYEGLLARDFMALIEMDDTVVSYQEEPPPFKWTDGWKIYRYHPDVALTMLDRRMICVEVKPLSKLLKHRIYAHRSAVEEAAFEAGYDEFQIWTEREIRTGCRLANAYLVTSGQSFSPASEDALAIRQALFDLGGSARIADVRRHANLDDQAYRAIIGLICAGQIRPKSMDVPIDDHCLIELA